MKGFEQKNQRMKVGFYEDYFSSTKQQGEKNVDGDKEVCNKAVITFWILVMESSGNIKDVGSILKENQLVWEINLTLGSGEAQARKQEEAGMTLRS